MDVAAFARGYLSLIGSSNRGRGVSEASDSLAPTVDISGMLGANLRQTARAVSASYSVGALIAVPPGELWNVHNITARITTPVAGAITAARIYFQPGEDSASDLFVLPGDAMTLGVGTRDYLAYTPGVAMLLTSGTELGVVYRAIDVNVEVILSVYFDRYTGA